MLLSTLFNLTSATDNQGAIFASAVIDGCLFIDWQHSFRYLPELTPSREQNADYSSNLCSSRKNAELEPKPNCGRYRTKLVVPR